MIYWMTSYGPGIKKLSQSKCACKIPEPEGRNTKHNPDRENHGRESPHGQYRPAHPHTTHEKHPFSDKQSQIAERKTVWRAGAGRPQQGSRITTRSQAHTTNGTRARGRREPGQKPRLGTANQGSHVLETCNSEKTGFCCTRLDLAAERTDTKARGHTGVASRVAITRV